MGAVLDSPWVQNPFRRRGAVVIAAIVLAVLCVWPRPYLARAQLLPNDSGGSLASLLGSAGGGGGALALGALLGGHQSIESDITIARSQAVLVDVVRRLRLEGHFRDRDIAGAERAVRAAVDIESIRGGILQITVVNHDQWVAKALVTDYVLALRERLGALNLEQAAQRKTVATNRMSEAATNLANAQAALDRFRATNRLAAPEVQLGAAISLMTDLQTRLHAKQVELQTLQQFATADNIQVQSARAEAAALQGQIAAAQTRANNSAGPSLGGMTPQISEYGNLYRNERYAEVEFDVYKRYLDTVTVDELSALINMDVIEPPFVSPDRQYNAHAVGALILLLLLGVLAEFYIARPPPGRR